MTTFVTGVRLAGYGAAYFFASGAFMSYWPVWLRDRGIDDAEIGRASCRERVCHNV